MSLDALKSTFEEVEREIKEVRSGLDEFQSRLQDLEATKRWLISRLGSDLPENSHSQSNGLDRPTYADCCEAVLRENKQPMRTPEIVKSVSEMGYYEITNPKNFHNSIFGALAHDERFEKIDRGTWKLSLLNDEEEEV